MAKIVSITEHFEHFLNDLKDSFWGDLEARTKLTWKRFFESESERLRRLYTACDSYERGPRQAGQYRNGYYERDFVTRFGTLRLRIARTRGKSFLPAGLAKFQRRAPEVALLIHLPEIQPGMEKPHPPRIYTSGLTSPFLCSWCPAFCLFALQIHLMRTAQMWSSALAPVGRETMRPVQRGCVKASDRYPGRRVSGNRKLTSRANVTINISTA